MLEEFHRWLNFAESARDVVVGVPDPRMRRLRNYFNGRDDEAREGSLRTRLPLYGFRFFEVLPGLREKTVFAGDVR